MSLCLDFVDAARTSNCPYVNQPHNSTLWKTVFSKPPKGDIFVPRARQWLLNKHYISTAIRPFSITERLIIAVSESVVTWFLRRKKNAYWKRIFFFAKIFFSTNRVMFTIFPVQERDNVRKGNEGVHLDVGKFTTRTIIKQLFYTNTHFTFQFIERNNKFVKIKLTLFPLKMYSHF